MVLIAQWTNMDTEVKLKLEKYGYKCENQIGEGSYGKVYRGRCLQSGRTIAFKVIPKISQTESELKSLKQECDILRTLNHPNIIQLLDSFETKHVLVLVTEYAKYSLYQVLKEKGTLPEDRVQKVAANLVSALYYLHSNRILHRDIKPQNILVGQDELVKLCDFGFARKIGLGTYVLTSVKGTPLYMAPEIIDNKTYDESADLWSLGCILYELVDGKPPFSTNSINALTNMVKNDPVKWPDNVSSSCLSFLQGLLEKDSKKRLIWPLLLEHTFVSKNVYVVKTEGLFPLTKALSPSQELVKEYQRGMLEKKLNAYTKVLSRTNRKLLATQKKLHRYSNDTLFIRHPALTPHKPNNVQFPLEEIKNFKTADLNLKYNEPSGRIQQPMIENKHVDVNYEQDRRSSSSSCETLTSSSDEESENEDVQTIVLKASPKHTETQNGIVENMNKLAISEKGDKNGNGFHQDDNTEENCSLWKSAALFTLHSFGSEDKQIESDEWVDFITKTMKEVIKSPKTLCEKHFLTMLVAPLRNHLASTIVVEKIAGLLSMPFTVHQQNEPELMKDIETLYLDTKVVPNLLYACKLSVRRRIIEKKSLDLQDIASTLPAEDLESLYKSLRLICFLVHCEEDFVIQFCDSVCVLQVLAILKLFLKLDKRKSCLTADTLAILCQVIRTVPSNVTILEELLLHSTGGQCELWRLLNHITPVIQARALRVLAYLVLFSEKTNEQIVQGKCSRLWNLLKNSASHKEQSVSSAAKFVVDNLRYSSATRSKELVTRSPIP